ncbi:MAG: hypothetical protein WB974_21405 [Acidobacteriaceae bacterium]
MAKEFRELRERLLRAGVAPRHVRRYVTELSQHQADLIAEEEQAGCSRAEAETTAMARLGSVETLVRTMIERRELRSWTARAPWAVLGLGPLAALMAAWGIALTILVSGWVIFLPQASTPFNHPLRGFAIYYFGVGRLLYYTAPLLVGWAFAAMAIRQRVGRWWLLPGLMLIAWCGGMARVHAARTTTGWTGAVGVHLAGGHGVSTANGGDGIHALVLLALTLAPYLVWRWSAVFRQQPAGE